MRRIDEELTNLIAEYTERYSSRTSQRIYFAHLEQLTLKLREYRVRHPFTYVCGHLFDSLGRAARIAVRSETGLRSRLPRCDPIEDLVPD